MSDPAPITVSVKRNVKEHEADIIAQAVMLVDDITAHLTSEEQLPENGEFMKLVVEVRSYHRYLRENSASINSIP